MKNPLPRHPNPGDVQTLINLYNTGRLAQAEALARTLIDHHPNDLVLNNVLGSALAQQGKGEAAIKYFRKAAQIRPDSAETHMNLGLALQQQGKVQEAMASLRKALALKPDFAESHYNLGVALQDLGKRAEAIASYQRALRLKPALPMAHFNLGAALQAEGRRDEAIASYRQALALEPGFVEAHTNLGAALQEQGRLEEAVASYRKALAIRPDAQTHYNLGTALRNQGHLDDAIASYRQALALEPDYAAALSNLGEALRDRGQFEEAVASYQRALAIDPGNAEASYNLGLFLHDLGELERAIPYFERSRLDDWQERVLYCLYKTERWEEFEARLAPLLASRNNSPLLATLATHYATNFGVEDAYDFCRNPMDFVYHGRIEELAAPDSRLRAELLRDIGQAEIDLREQGRLHHGIQSSGNLFRRPEASFQTLAALVAREVERYKARFAGADCELMRSFPAVTEFSSSWYVKMHQGGHLTSHIHETGWISGSLYLALPREKPNGDEGSIEFSTDGDGYPRRHDDFPVRTITPEVGDIVMFPSSVFHRTIPFASAEERICIAFDVKPAQSHHRLTG